jgi:predicted dehydrogenase
MSTIGRRGFLRRSVSGAAVSVGAFDAGAGQPAARSAPSDRVVLGLIGLGVRGRDHHLRLLSTNPAVEIGALCDVDRRHADFAAQILMRSSGRRPAVYGDFRSLLERRDIDAVVISTPDHWHSIIAIAAMEAGKDVYCEKPLTLFIAEGRQIVNTARQYGTVFQTGSQQRSDWRFRQAVELVRTGRIGRLRRITTHLGNPGTTSGAFINPGVWEPQQTPPEGLDFDMWLGPAPYHAYSPNRCHFEFRYNLDHSGGRITDWGAHHNDIAQWALDADRSGPVTVEASGSFNKAGPYDYANYFRIRYLYANGVELICENEGGNGVRFEGSDGWIFATRMRLEASNPEILRRADSGAGTQAFDERNKGEEIPGTDAHHNNWLECIRSRKPCSADVETGHRSATVCHLGNIALRLGRAVKWDPSREEFIGDAAANLLRDKAFRAPWRL